MKCISTSISFTKEYNAVWVGTINAQDYEEKTCSHFPCNTGYLKQVATKIVANSSVCLALHL